MSRLSAIEPANVGIRLRGTIDAIATQCGFARGMSTPMPQSLPALEIVMGLEERIAKPRRKDAPHAHSRCLADRRRRHHQALLQLLLSEPRRHVALCDRTRAQGWPARPEACRRG